MAEFYDMESNYTKIEGETNASELRKKPIARNQNIVEKKMDDEILLYDFAADRASCLNDTSAGIWRLPDGSKTNAEISDEISVQAKSLVSEEIDANVKPV